MNRIITAKWGSNALLNADKRTLNLETTDGIIYDIVSTRKNTHAQILMVTSGAIASGRDHVTESAITSEKESYFSSLNKDILDRMAASVGQPHLTEIYQSAFHRAYTQIFQQEPKEGQRFISQILPSPVDLTDDEASEKVAATLLALLEVGFIPVVNGNDATSGYNLVTGDNDQMSAQLVLMVQKLLKQLGQEKDLLLSLFTDVKGVYSGDPKHQDSRLLPELFTGTQLNELIEKAEQFLRDQEARGEKTNGTGNMASKLRAAKIAAEAGIPVVISQWEPGKLEEIAQGGNFVGTRVLLKE